MNSQKPLTVMGLMSGTSVDGVDACLATFWEKDEQLQFNIVATYSHDMPDVLRQRLLTCMAEKHIHLEELCSLNVDVGTLFAEAASGLLQTHQIDPTTVDAIGSHGQTIYHWPPTVPGKLGYTLQIGEPSIIVEKTGIKTIADFRTRDMAAGGQGAPLVCFADLLLFQHATDDRALQNIGGIGNVTVVPAKSSNTPLMAFDTGPGNMLMDAAMMKFFGQPYDKNGDVAARGHIHSGLLDTLMKHAYLAKQPPKTTGREEFGEAYFQELQKQYSNIKGEDWVATFTQFTANSIADAYIQHVFPKYAVNEMIIGGGGFYNKTLLKFLSNAFELGGHPIKLSSTTDYGVPDKYKEALAFALLSWANLQGKPNNIVSCTGAQHPVVMGKVSI